MSWSIAKITIIYFIILICFLITTNAASSVLRRVKFHLDTELIVVDGWNAAFWMLGTQRLTFNLREALLLHLMLVLLKFPNFGQPSSILSPPQNVVLNASSCPLILKTLSMVWKFLWIFKVDKERGIFYLLETYNFISKWKVRGHLILFPIDSTSRHHIWVLRQAEELNFIY